MKKTIRIALNPDAQMGKRKKKWQVAVADVVGGIAVHYYEGAWRLTQAKSGLRITGTGFYGTNKEARVDRAVLLRAVSTWSEDTETIISDLRAAAAPLLSGMQSVEVIIADAYKKHREAAP